MSLRRRLMMQSGDEDLVYLDAIGVNYIDTEIIPNNGVSIEVECEPYVLYGYRGGIFGTHYEGTQELRYLCIQHSLGSNNYQIGLNTSRWTNIAGWNNIKKIRFEPPYIFINDTLKYTASIPTDFYITLRLFSSGINTTIGGCVRIKRARMYIGDVTLALFVPKLHNGKPCMFNEVTQKYHYNLGAGKFGYKTLSGKIIAPIP